MRLQEQPNVSYNYGQINDVGQSLKEFKKELSIDYNVSNVKESATVNTYWNNSLYANEQIWVMVYDDRIEIVTRDEYDAKTINN